MDRDGGPTFRLLRVGGDLSGGDELLEALDRAEDLEVTSVEGDEGALDRLETVDGVVGVHRPPAVDGVDLLEAVREATPTLPFVLLAAGHDAAAASRAVAADVSAYVPRETVSAVEFVDRVRTALSEASPGRGSASRMPIEDLTTAEELRLKDRAMDAAPIGITISDPERPDNPLIYLNDAFAELTGYSKEETVGRNCRFLQGEESDPAAIATMREGVDEARPVSVELVNYRKDGEQFWNKVDIAPVRNADGEVTNYVGFQTDVTARKEAEFEVRRERRNLDHLVTRINGLVGDVTSELVRATSRGAVERAVCERIAATDTYAFAWIGRHDLARDAIVPSATAGEFDPDDADLECSLVGATDGASPVVGAFETGAVQVLDDPTALAAARDREAWLSATDVAGMAAVPLGYGDTTYGVLVVYVTRSDALNERETVVLEALGRATATAINALERGRIIAADNVVELEFEVRDRGLFLVDLSAREGCRVEYRGSVYRSDGSLLVFVETDADPEAVESVAATLPDIEGATLIRAGDGESLFEFDVAEGSIVTRLAERGARIRSMVVDDGVARVQVELPSDAEARAIVDRLRERYPESELVAYRERERPPETTGEFIADLEDRLTERQLTALHTAYVSGFYEWNRPVSGDDLAATMGVARSTFHQHLRAAERKLVEGFFDRDGPRT